MTDDQYAAPPTPLEPGDPPLLGAARLTGRLDASDSGTVYAAELDGELVAVVLLSAGAETDSYGRARFEQAVREASDVAGSAVIGYDDDAELAPWAVVRSDSEGAGMRAAMALLAPVTLADVAPVGAVSGPGFRPHWLDRGGHGRWRVWPLPWPHTLGAAGRWTFLAAFALVLAIASIALWISIQVFHSQPPAPRPGPGPVPGPITRPTPSLSTPSPTTSQAPTRDTSPPPQPTGPGGPSSGLPTATSVPPIV